VLIPVGSLPIQTRQNAKMANAWATASAHWGGGTTNIRSPARAIADVVAPTASKFHWRAAVSPEIVPN
jgi:hypothetical protein